MNSTVAIRVGTVVLWTLLIRLVIMTHSSRNVTDEMAATRQHLELQKRSPTSIRSYIVRTKIGVNLDGDRAADEQDDLMLTNFRGAFTCRFVRGRMLKPRFQQQSSTVFSSPDHNQHRIHFAMVSTSTGRRESRELLGTGCFMQG